MADVTLLQQDVILLKLRIAKLENDKKNLLSDVAVLIAERDQADRANKRLSDSLENTEKVCVAMKSSHNKLQIKYEYALIKIEQLKRDILGSDAEESSDEGDDTPSATSIQEDDE